MKNIKALCFDLDDTLWDLGPVIPRAEQILYQWLCRYYPRVPECFTQQDILRLRQQVAQEHPELRHDLTRLRRKVLGQIAERAGYGHSLADKAFAVFQSARNDVTLFADVEPALAELGKRYRLLTLSNGNADLKQIGIDRHFAASYSAREIGCAKPDPEIFVAVCRNEGLRPTEVLHVGDHPENDIVAAQRIGMVTVWVNRTASQWPDEHPHPHTTVSCLGELTELLLQQDRS